MENVIKVEQLKKEYGYFTAVKGVSFGVKEGEIFGLLGENGAGKTTTLEMIEGLRRPTSGTIKVFGMDVKKKMRNIKERIGVQLQSSAYFAFLNLREILDLFGSFYQTHSKPDDLLAMVNLQDKADSYVGNLSGGQKQRFSIVASLVNDPEIVFLDEPTTGLDPLARRNLWNVIADIKKQGKTVILTTHYLEEAEVLCDRIAIMEKGQILQMGTTDNLVEQAEFPFVIRFLIEEKSYGAFEKLSQLGKFDNALGKLNVYELKLKKKDDLEKALPLVQNMNPESLTVGRISLEDLFIELTGKSIESS